MNVAKLISFALVSIASINMVYAQQINIVGSSTVYPFTTLAAERFSQVKGGDTPKVESTGTGGGIKLLCAGVGANYPDIANASRAIKASEIKLCNSNNVSAPLEVKIGFDGIVLAHSNVNDSFSITRQEIFTALARDLPNNNGELTANPHKNWRDINPSFPDLVIKVYGPPPTSGTRDAFVELAMETGCKNYPGMNILKAKDEEHYEAACTAIREDGAFIEAGENDNLIIQRLVSNPDTLGVFGYSFLEENIDKVAGIAIDGVEPSFEAIEAEEYALARALYIYVKSEHATIKPALEDFVMFYVDDAAIGEDGFLIDRGLVPLPSAELTKVRQNIASSF